MLSSKFASSNLKKNVNKLEHVYKEVQYKPQQELSLAQLSPSLLRVLTFWGFFYILKIFDILWIFDKLEIFDKISQCKMTN